MKRFDILRATKRCMLQSNGLGLVEHSLIESGNNGRLSSEALLMLAALLNLYKLDLLSDEGLRELIATGLTSRNDNALI